ncbi:MAG: PAS domain-containing sensor histidine kinase [Bacteriovoracaceae bacterium]|nr:PAS domain-containing sensor histidine kinase [Bacteriovoracaceae bacterium]
MSTELLLKAEKKKFEAFFYGAESPLVIFKGPEFIIEMCNDKYRAIYPARELLGRTFLTAVPELKESPFPQILKGVYETGEHYISYEGLARIHNPNTNQLEERYFDTTFSRISFGDDEPFRIIATPREVTARVLTRKKLEATKLELEMERDLREIFISTLSHDLRTPMTVIKSAAQMLKRKANLPEMVKSLPDLIMSNVERADDMIRDLLDANRIKAGKGLPISIQFCRLDLIVQDGIAGLEKIHDKRFKFENKVDEINGYWDSKAILRLLENLANNAIKYGESQSDVTITLNATDEWVEISVHNFGHPIPEDEQKMLFNHYHRSKTAGRTAQTGWGIGLTLVKGIAEAHRGTVEVNSDAKNGTTFTVRMPRDARDEKCLQKSQLK